jgi:hypothetical protein
MSEADALKSIKYGLSSKLNYTKLDKEFSQSDQNDLAFTFLQLFEKPSFYTVNSRVYKSDLDLGDFWESGGAILVDKERIVIFWTNDLYDMF